MSRYRFLGMGNPVEQDNSRLQHSFMTYFQLPKLLSLPQPIPKVTKFIHTLNQYQLLKHLNTWCTTLGYLYLIMINTWSQFQRMASSFHWQLRQFLWKFLSQWYQRNFPFWKGVSDSLVAVHFLTFNITKIGRLVKEILNHWATRLFQPLYMVG